MKVDLFLAIFFPLLLRMLNRVDKGVGFRHAVDDEEYGKARVKHRTL